jgi:polysaccharide export outer membrane protein
VLTIDHPESRSHLRTGNTLGAATSGAQSWLRLLSTLLLIGASAAALSACSTVSRSGPSAQAIRSDATAYLKASKADQLDYYVIDITKAIAEQFDTLPASLYRADFRGSTVAPSMSYLNVGDVVEVAIFESKAGGLFVPEGAGSRPGNFITLPQQAIDASGYISVPYAGKIAAGGKSVPDVQDEIVAKLKDRAIEPQVVIRVVSRRAGSVSVMGEVKAPGTFELQAQGDRLLDIVSKAGGTSAPEQESYVVLQRGNGKLIAPIRMLVETPSRNIYVRPGDTVFVVRDRRTFLAFGASGINGSFDFGDTGLTLAEAVAKAGGLLDNRADPGQVFIYRQVSRDTLAALGLLRAEESREGTAPVIFRANLRDPSSLFVAQQFLMDSGDILYVDNAASVEIQKFVGVVNTVVDGSVGNAQQIKTLIE